MIKNRRRNVTGISWLSILNVKINSNTILCVNRSLNKLSHNFPFIFPTSASQLSLVINERQKEEVDFKKSLQIQF